MDISLYKNNGLCGLKNLGNTCYMNSAIQCMSNTLVLTNYFLSDKYLEDIDKSKIESGLVLEWRRLIEVLWNNDCIISPKSFTKKVLLLSKKLNYSVVFGNYLQNDVQEFLLFMINTLHDALSSEVIIKISGKVLTEVDKLALEAMKAWKEYFKNSYSVIIDLFYSQHCSIIRCPDCTNVSIVYNPVCYYTLPIPNNAKTLYDCLNKYTENEILNNDNLWMCDKCNEKKKANKKILLWSTPKILIICLKRFNSFSKIDKYIDFPLENLDLKDYCIGYDKNTSKYNLYGICNHSGNLNGGHYYAYCKNLNSNWYMYNDTKVIKIDNKSNVVTKNAYCLFYKKVA